MGSRPRTPTELRIGTHHARAAEWLGRSMGALDVGDHAAAQRANTEARLALAEAADLLAGLVGGERRSA